MSTRTIFFGTIHVSSAEDTIVPLQSYDQNGGDSFSGRNTPDEITLNIVSYSYRGCALGTRAPKLRISCTGVSPTASVEFSLARRLIDTSFTVSESDVAGNIITIPIARGRGLPSALVFTISDTGVLLPEYSDANATVRTPTDPMLRYLLPAEPSARIPVSFPWYTPSFEPSAPLIDGYPASWYLIGDLATGVGFPTVVSGGIARIVSWAGSWTDEMLYQGATYSLFWLTVGKRYFRINFAVCSSTPIAFDVSEPTLPPLLQSAWNDGRLNLRSIRVLGSEDIPALTSIIVDPAANPVHATDIYPIKSGVSGNLSASIMIMAGSDGSRN